MNFYWLLGAILLTTMLTMIGHCATWFRVINCLHATTWSHCLTHRLTYLVFVILGVMPLLLFIHTYDTLRAIPTLVQCATIGNEPFSAWECVCLGCICQIFPPLLTFLDIPTLGGELASPWLGYYWGVMCSLGITAIFVWLIRPRLWRCRNRQIWREIVREHNRCSNTQSIRASGSFWLRFPGCQSLQLDFIQRQIGPPALPTSVHSAFFPSSRSASEPRSSSQGAARSLRLLHLTDFHFGGGVPEAYYEWALSTIMERVQGELNPDLILLTGDFLDHDDWRVVLSRQLRRLAAPHGVWFVLGNHDFRVDTAALRLALTEECGFTALGGKTQRLTLPAANTTQRPWQIELIGDEKPWGNEPERWKNSQTFPIAADDKSLDLRIVLTHTPDQFRVWAKRFQTLETQPASATLGDSFAIRQLVLAGHTHGGQMCIPGIGPALTPCYHGVTFADGMFQKGSTLLHVPHGIAAQNPLRLFCPPEAVLLEWRCPEPQGTSEIVHARE